MQKQLRQKPEAARWGHPRPLPSSRICGLSTFELEPIQPGEAHEVPDREVAEQVIARAKKWDFVEAAYLWPADAPP
jgi:hypothetical protein